MIGVADLLPRLNARFGNLLLKLALALFGFFALVFAKGLANGGASPPPLDFFLAGYAPDSIVGLFGSSVERRAAAQATDLKQQLAIATALHKTSAVYPQLEHGARIPSVIAGCTRPIETTSG